MTTTTITKSQWSRYFAALSASLSGQQAFIEVAGLELGDQVEARWIALVSITYDNKDDVVVLDLGDLNHVVQHPTRVDAADDAGAITSIEIVDREGTQHIVRLRDPLLIASAD